MAYKFNEQIAKLYEVNEAIFIQNLWWWIEKNRQSEINYYTVELHNKKGEIITVSDYWTYNSMRAFGEIFPFWSKRQIETVINNCQKKGIIYRSRLNKIKYDKTTWYALSPQVKLICQAEQNREVEITNRGNPYAQNVKPIPDTKPVRKPRGYGI